MNYMKLDTLRLKRHLVLSPDNQHFLVWWSISEQEVFPWAPHMREEDRANVFLFKINQAANEQAVRMGFLRTHSDPLALRYSKIPFLPQFHGKSLCSFTNPKNRFLDPDSPHLELLPPQQLLGLHYLGQETSRRGEISLDSSVFFPVEGDRQLRRKSPPGGKVALVSPVICSDFVGNLAFLGCADGKNLFSNINIKTIRAIF